MDAVAERERVVDATTGSGGVSAAQAAPASDEPGTAKKDRTTTKYVILRKVTHIDEGQTFTAWAETGVTLDSIGGAAAALRAFRKSNASKEGERYVAVAESGFQPKTFVTRTRETQAFE